MPNTDSAAPATLSFVRSAMFDHMKAKGMFPPRWYALAPFARVRLQALFGRTGIDLGRLRFTTNGAFGQDGITLGNTIRLTDRFGARAAGDQLSLLAHEIAHSVQYMKLGWIGFLSRYKSEWAKSNGNPYGVPQALRTIPLGQLDPVDGRFYLDQICDRFRLAAETGQ